MYNALLDGLNKDQTGTVFPDEAELLLNESQLEAIVNKYEQAEKTQKRIDDLRTLVVLGETIANSGPSISGQEIFALPYNPNVNVVTPKNPSGTNKGYLFLLRASFQIQYVNNACGYKGLSKLLKSKIMRSDIKDEIARDPFNKPTDERLYHETTSDTLTLLTAGQSFGISANIDYLRYARDIILVGPNVDCELPLHMRKEIVDIAIRKKLEAIESQRYPSKVNENRNVIT
jgi:hypothetical protein